MILLDWACSHAPSDWQRLLPGAGQASALGGGVGESRSRSRRRYLPLGRRQRELQMGGHQGREWPQLRRQEAGWRPREGPHLGGREPGPRPLRPLRHGRKRRRVRRRLVLPRLRNLRRRLPGCGPTRPLQRSQFLPRPRPKAGQRQLLVLAGQARDGLPPASSFPRQQALPPLWFSMRRKPARGQVHRTLAAEC